MAENSRQSQQYDSRAGLPEVQRLSAITSASRPDGLNATTATSVTHSNTNVISEERRSSRSGSIVKTTKDELFVNGSAGPSPVAPKKHVNPIDSGHELADNLLEDAGNDAAGDLDIRHH